MLYDPSVARAFKGHTFHDPDITAAAKQVGSAEWTVYTPYNNDYRIALDKLRALCPSR